MDYSARQKRLRKRLAELKLDAFFVTHLPNIRYLCGFTGSAGVLAFSGTKAAFFTDGRYTEQARTEVCGAKAVVVKRPAFTEAVDWLLREKVRSLGIEAEHVTVAMQQNLKKLIKKLSRARVRLRPTSLMVEKLRMEKEQPELDQIRAAVLLASNIFSPIV